MLAPEDYGVLSLMIIFTNLATVFIQTGFNTALIQNKDVTEKDYSSVMWLSLMIALFMYGIIFIAAPYIATYYSMPGIIFPLRVLALMLFPGAINSVQLAKVTREMDFKKIFYSNVGAITVSGIAGIIFAYLGMGIWALVIQTMLNVTVACIVMAFVVDWHPKFILEMHRVKNLFSFGWKLLVSSLLDTAYQEIQSLVIGKKYDSGTLGYYNRGKQFPQFVINAINGTVQSVMLPAMSVEQDNQSNIKYLVRNSIRISSYLVFPIMAGLAGVAMPLVSILLTEKWLPCVPYMQICCFSLAFYPVHSCNLQAINAMGRSDIFLTLEVIKKTIGIIALVIAVVCFDSPMAIAMTGAITTIISFFINAYPNIKLLNYTYYEQIRDIVPSMSMALIMLWIVLLINNIGMNVYITLVIQVFVGIICYLMMSLIFRVDAFKIILSKIKVSRNK